MLIIDRIRNWLDDALLSVPVQAKIIGISLVPILILGLSINYWVTSGLSDWLSYILIDARVHAAMEAGRRSVTLVTILSAVFSIFVSLLLAYILTRPILALREMAQKVAAGQSDARAKVWARDEIGQLAIAINTMTDHLISAQSDLARKNRRLDIINQIALASDEQADIHDVLYKILEKILSVIPLKAGWVYLRDPERQQFHLASWYAMPDELGPYFIQQPADPLCVCQQNLLDDARNSHVYIAHCPRLRKYYQVDGEYSHISIPLEARGQKFGIINLLPADEKPISDDDLDLLTSIGTQISDIVANAWLRLKLMEKEVSRQALLESLVKAQEEERGRLARELHDGAGQTLTSLLVRMKTLEKTNSSPEAKKSLITMEEIIAQTIEQIRELSYRLRPIVLEEFGLSVALDNLVNETAATSGLEFEFESQLSGQQFSSEVEVALYRIAQEGITNILRHAHAGKVSLKLSRTNTGIQLCVDDDGIGFDPNRLPGDSSKPHLGLISMRERAEMLGGTLDVYTASGEGTSIQVIIPMKDAS